MKIPIGSDCDVRITGASMAETGSYFNSGTANWQLKEYTENDSGNVLASGSLSYVAPTTLRPIDGSYLGTIESTDTATLSNGTSYIIKVVFVQGSYDATRFVPCEAIYQGNE